MINNRSFRPVGGVNDRHPLYVRLLTQEQVLSVILPLLIGAASFFIIYGITPLDPCNDAWIMAGYDEADIIQHYSGWLAFRNSAWRFPLGLAENMAAGDGTMISYTDSIPWAAIFFKVFRDYLPDSFQYLGWYTLLCYILQSIAAFKILCFKTADRLYSAIGTLLFSFAPILMERAFRHTALGSQWLVLFAVLLYLRHKKSSGMASYGGYLILGCLGIGIHPYFLPMIFCFSLLCVYKDICQRNWRAAGAFMAGLGGTYAAGCVIGVLGSGINVSRSGFGYYSMNLNAVINPTSCGGYNWSSLLKVHPQTLGNYDGFNYLGAGVLALILMVLVLSVVSDGWKKEIMLVKGNLPLLFVMVLLAAFAVSNVVTYNGNVIFTVPLPEWILEICGIFRASSRMFYPVYYMVMFFLLLQLWRYRGKTGRKGAIFLLLTAVTVQLLDLRHVIGQKHQDMERNAGYVSILQDETLEEAAKEGRSLILDGFSGNTRTVAVWALKNGMNTYFSTANSGTYPKCAQLKDEILMTVFTDQDLGDIVIATTDTDTVSKYLQLPSVCVYTLDNGICFIYKDKESMERAAK